MRIHQAVLGSLPEEPFFHRGLALPFDSEYWFDHTGQVRYGWSVGYRMLQGLRSVLRLQFGLDADYLEHVSGIYDSMVSEMFGVEEFVEEELDLLAGETGYLDPLSTAGDFPLDAVFKNPAREVTLSFLRSSARNFVNGIL